MSGCINSCCICTLTAIPPGTRESKDHASASRTELPLGQNQGHTDSTEMSTFLCTTTLAFPGQSPAHPPSHSTQSSNSKEKSVNTLHELMQNTALSRLLGGLGSGEWMMDQSRRRGSTGTARRDKTHCSTHAGKTKGRTTATGQQINLPSKNTRYHTHWWFGSTEGRVQVTFQKKMEKERGEQGNTRETKPSVTIQAVHPKETKNGNRTQNRVFLCSPLHDAQMDVCTQWRISAILMNHLSCTCSCTPRK